jgi:hypothetical protein
LGFSSYLRNESWRQFDLVYVEIIWAGGETNKVDGLKLLSAFVTTIVTPGQAGTAV